MPAARKTNASAIGSAKVSAKVSVIVPAYNPGTWLAPCINSILNQSMTDLEILLVDDGSTDGSVAALSVGDPRLKILTQANRGAAAARNLGLSEARGRWLSFVDADDLLHPDKLAHQLTYLAQNPTLQLTGGSWCRFAGELPSVPEVCADPLWRPQSSLSWLITALNQNLMMQPAAWLVARSLVERVGPWHEALTLNDDGEYFARIILATERVGFCARALSYYRSGTDQSLSAGRSHGHFQSALLALELMSTHLQAATADKGDDELTSQANQALSRAWTQLAVDSYPYVPELSARCEANARQHGGFEPVVGGGWIKRVSGPLGWRLARRLQARVYDLGYRQLAQRRAARRSSDA